MKPSCTMNDSNAKVNINGNIVWLYTERRGRGRDRDELSRDDRGIKRL